MSFRACRGISRFACNSEILRQAQDDRFHILWAYGLIEKLQEKMMKYDLQQIGSAFRIHGDYLDGQPYGSGHINDTFAVSYDQGGTPIRYIFQRINHNIFKDPPALMENIRRVTEHQRSNMQNTDNPSRRALTLIPARNDECFHKDDSDNYWRVYIFIENAQTYNLVESPKQAFQVAKAFGEFQNILSNIPGDRLHETIPAFHDTPKRLEALKKAIASDEFGRLKTAEPEVEFVMKREEMTGTLLDLARTGDIPERITHNDTKINNVMLDDATGDGICVIDLDTVMPGLALYDFGDMVRTSTCSAREDTTDLAEVFMRPDMYEALLKGYLSTVGDILTPAEKEYLPFSGKLITLEIGIRFLTDYLSGDSYFKTHREGQNLDRCRMQFKLVSSIEEQENKLMIL